MFYFTAKTAAADKIPVLKFVKWREKDKATGEFRVLADVLRSTKLLEQNSMFFLIALRFDFRYSCRLLTIFLFICSTFVSLVYSNRDYQFTKAWLYHLPPEYSPTPPRRLCH